MQSFKFFKSSKQFLWPIAAIQTPATSRYSSINIHTNKPTLSRINKKEPEITIYIKGFLSKNEKPNNFDRWQLTHHKLVFKHKWNERFIGWKWDCGEVQLPVPFLSGSNLLYALYNHTKILRATNPVALMTALGVDASIFTAMVVYQYFLVEENIHMMAPKLALDLIAFSKKYENVRVVSHSLGCKLLLNALPYVPDKHKPRNIHMCAPAFSESDHGHLLDNSSKHQTYIYYTPNDVVLSTFLNMTKNKNPVGAYGLSKDYQKVKTINVTDYFKNEWFIHNNYHKISRKFIVNDYNSPTTNFPRDDIQ
jgi:hypothetical protein